MVDLVNATNPTPSTTSQASAPVQKQNKTVRGNMWLKTPSRTYSSVWHLGMGGGLVILCFIERRVRLICGNRACYNKSRFAPCGGMPHLDAETEIDATCRSNLCRTSFPSVAVFVSSLTVLISFLSSSHYNISGTLLLSFGYHPYSG